MTSFIILIVVVLVISFSFLILRSLFKKDCDTCYHRRRGNFIGVDCDKWKNCHTTEKSFSLWRKL